MKDKEEFLIEFGKHLRKVREERSISIREFELECDLDRHSLSKIENGKWNPSLYTIYKICECLNIDIETLFKDFM